MLAPPLSLGYCKFMLFSMLLLCDFIFWIVSLLQNLLIIFQGVFFNFSRSFELFLAVLEAKCAAFLFA